MNVKHSMKHLGLFLPPMFFSCLVSLCICILLANDSVFFQVDLSYHPVSTAQEVTYEINDEQSNGLKVASFFAQAKPEPQDFIREMYRQPGNQEQVLEFFTDICASSEIASVILANSDHYNIPPALAFALCWEESRFNPLAVNSKNRDESTDRGLFQLNNRSFPRLDTQAFFNPDLNARYGMSHLRHCLDIGGTEIAALAMYNAGTGRVRNSGTPKTTLDYVSRILGNKNEIERRFMEYKVDFDQQIDDFTEIAEGKPERPRFVFLLPLIGSR